MRNQYGSNNPAWKGDKVGYDALHHWIRKNFKRPSFCEVCGTKKAKKFVWANITDNYTRNIKNYRNMCDSCHKKHDGIVNNILDKNGKIPLKTRKKLSKIHSGKKLSEEHKKKIGQAHRGMKRSAQARRNISEGVKKYWRGFL